MIEAFLIKQSINLITSAHIEKLEQLNDKMNAEIKAGDFTNLFESNLEFHNTFIEISDNEMLKKFILPIKHRLYDFPRQNFIPEWELRNGEEHSQVIECLKKRDGIGAAIILQDVHWSFETQKEFIYSFYNIK